VSDSRYSRRTLLFAVATTLSAAGLTTGVSGCEAEPADPTAPEGAPIDPLTPVLIGQQELLLRYEQAISAAPELPFSLSDLQAQASAHTEALLAAAPAAAAQLDAAGSAAGRTPTSSDPSSTQPIPSPVPPADPARALSELIRAVDAAASSLAAAALRAGGELAALLGSCAASTACHARLLG